MILINSLTTCINIEGDVNTYFSLDETDLPCFLCLSNGTILVITQFHDINIVYAVDCCYINNTENMIIVEDEIYWASLIKRCEFRKGLTFRF